MGERSIALEVGDDSSATLPPEYLYTGIGEFHELGRHPGDQTRAALGSTIG